MLFNINNIYQDQDTKRFICYCQCNSLQDAEEICVKYTIIVKESDLSGELYKKGSFVIIEAKNRENVLKIASCINNLESKGLHY